MFFSQLWWRAFSFSIFQLPLISLKKTFLFLFKEKVSLFLHFLIGHIFCTSNSSYPFLSDILLVSSHLQTPLSSLPEYLRFCFILDFSPPKYQNITFIGQDQGMPCWYALGCHLKLSTAKTECSLSSSSLPLLQILKGLFLSY